MITTNRTEPSQAEYKIILIGDPSVGKTCYISKYTNRSSTLSGSTIGVEYASKVIDLPNQSTCKVTLWDTSGSQYYRSVTCTHFRKTHGALLFFDLTNRSSFDSLHNWQQMIQEYAKEDTVVILLGNKADAEDQVIPDQDIQAFKDSHNMIYYQISAKTGLNVQKSFQALITGIYNVELNKSLLHETINSQIKLKNELEEVKLKQSQQKQCF